MLQQLLGNEGLRADLSAALAAGRLPHGLLFCGAAGLGRNFAARLAAADYLYPQGGPGAQAVVQGRDSECITVASEGAGDQITAKQIRPLRAALYGTSLSARGRVALIRDAHKMNAAASGALLKILEEPPAGALFLLTAENAAAVLPTIYSRCAVYHLAPLGRAECLARLGQAGCSPQQAELLWAAYGGALGLCLAAARDKKRFAALQAAAGCLAMGQAGDAYGLMKAARGFENKKQRGEAMAFLRDLAALYAAALEGRTLPGAEPMPRAGAARGLAAVQGTMARIAAYGELRLCFTLLALQLAGVG